MKIRNFRLDDPTLDKWIIILGVLALSALGIKIAQKMPWEYLVGTIVAGVAGLIALKNMPLALTFVLLTSATTGLKLGTGTSTPLPLGLLAIAGLSVIWVLKMIVIDRQVRLKSSPFNAPVIFFLLAAAVSWAVGNAIWDWRIPIHKSNLLVVQAGQYALFALSFAAAFLTAHQPLSEKDLKRWMWIVVAIGFAGIVIELYTGSGRTRGFGMIGSVLMWPVVLVVAQLLLNPDFKGWPRLASLIGLAVWAAWAARNVIFKGGWVPALIGLAALLWFYKRKYFLTLAAIGALIAAFNWRLIYDSLLAPEIASASTLRPLYWLDVARLTSRSPVFGLGLVNYFFYWKDPTFIPLSRLTTDWDTWNYWGYAPPSHNMFVDVYAQTGIVGLLLFLWGMGAAVWIAYRVSRAYPPGFMRAYTAGVFSGFVAMLAASFIIADLLIPFVYNITITGFSHSVYTWILFGTVLGLYYRHKDAPDQKKSA